MRIPSQARSERVGFNMTPMIDVVFLLIIFFLLSSHLARQETQLALPLPAAESAHPDAARDQPRVTIHVLADGTLLFANRTISTDELAGRLRERVVEHGSDLAVRIRGDRGVPYRHVEPILVACTQVGVWNVSYAVQRREKGD